MQNNIWKYALLLVTNKRVFMAILGAYYLTVPGVGVWGVGFLLLVGQLCGFFLEVPSGYVSDKIGHKKALVISHIFLLLSSISFFMAEDISLLIVATVFLSGGFAFHSGTGDVFLHETLNALGRGKDYASVMGKVSSVGFAVPILLTALVPFLVATSYKLPFVVMFAVDLVGLVTALSLVTPPVTPEHVKEIGLTNFRQVLREGHRLGFFTFALFSGILVGMLLGIEGFRSVYQVSLGLPVIWFGILFGIGRGLASLMLIWSGKISRATTLLSFFRIEFVVYASLILSLGFIREPWVIAVVFIVLNAFHWGFNKVSHTHLMGLIHTSKFKATLLSAEAQIRHIVAAVVAFLIGLAIEHFSYRQAFLYAGIAFVLLLLPLYIAIAKNPQAHSKPAH